MATIFTSEQQKLFKSALGNPTRVARRLLRAIRRTHDKETRAEQFRAAFARYARTRTYGRAAFVSDADAANIERAIREESKCGAAERLLISLAPIFAKRAAPLSAEKRRAALNAYETEIARADEMRSFGFFYAKQQFATPNTHDQLDAKLSALDDEYEAKKAAAEAEYIMGDTTIMIDYATHMAAINAKYVADFEAITAAHDTDDDAPGIGAAPDCIVRMYDHPLSDEHVTLYRRAAAAESKCENAMRFMQKLRRLNEMIQFDTRPSDLAAIAEQRGAAFTAYESATSLRQFIRDAEHSDMVEHAMEDSKCAHAVILMSTIREILMIRNGGHMTYESANWRRDIAVDEYMRQKRSDVEAAIGYADMAAPAPRSTVAAAPRKLWTNMPRSTAAVGESYEYICPITAEPIVKCGATVMGQIYEHSAIEEWLRDHDTDPMTNTHMTTKMIFEIPHANRTPPARMKEICDEIRTTATPRPAAAFAQIHTDYMGRPMIQLPTHMSAPPRMTWDSFLSRYDFDTQLLTPRRSGISNQFITHGSTYNVSAIRRGM